MRSFNSTNPELNGAAIAPLWRRALAAAIDCFLIFAIQMLLMLLSLAIYSVYDYMSTGVWIVDYDAKDINPSVAYLVSLLVIPYVLYHTLLLAYWSGHTPGKNFMLIRVVHKSGERISMLRSIVRTLLVPISAIPVLLGYLLFFRSRKNSSLHDMLVGSIVLQEEVEHHVIRGTIPPQPVSAHH